MQKVTERKRMDAYIGQIELLPYMFVPQGWLRCDGTKLQVKNYQALYSLLGVTFGGTVGIEFALPDLRGAEPMNGLAYYIAFIGIYPTRQD